MRKERIYSLDALKFFASILIVCHHFQQDLDISFAKFNFFGEGTYYGYLVELFFMISGYVAIRNQKGIMETDFKNYYLKKCSRIYPMHILATGMYCILWWVHSMVFGYWYTENPIGLWNIFASMLLISHGGVITNVPIAANNPIWYLCVLLICYVILFFLCKISKRWNIQIEYFFLGMILLGVGIQNYLIGIPFLNYYTARGYMSFFLGALLMSLLKKSNETIKKCIKSFAVCTLLFITILALSGISGIFDNKIMILVFLVFPSIIILAVESKIVRKIFSSRIWGEAGAVSFEIYLWHTSMILLLLIIIQVFHLNVSFASHGKMFLFVAGVVIVSAVIYYFVERPLHAFLIRKMKMFD